MNTSPATSSSPRRSLISGGAGFIGSHLTELLLRRGDHVTVVDDLSTGRISNLDSARQIAPDRLRFIEAELKRGLSPSIILHPYELVKPPASARLWLDRLLNPHLMPFLRDKSGFLKSLLEHFPVSPLGIYLDETLAAHV